MNTLRRTRALVVAAALVAASLSPPHPAHAAQATAVELHEVLADPQHYVGREFTLVGRFRSSNGQRLLLVGSDLQFVLPAGTRSVRAAGKNIELTGLLTRQEGKWKFQVSRLHPLPSDVEQFHARRGRITAGDYASLEQLIAWARQHAQWYQDAALASLADEAQSQVFDWEAQLHVRTGNASALLELARRAADTGLTEPRILTWRHQALWLQVGELNSLAAPRAETLARQLEQLFPAAQETPLATTPDEIARYLADPVGVFRDAPPEQLAQWPAVLRAQLLAHAIRRRAAEPAANLAELADRAAREVPHDAALLAELKLALAHQRAADAAQLTRPQVLALTTDFRALGQPASAQDLLRRWLEHRRQHLDPADADGRVELAADFHQLLDDQQSAADLCLQAEQLSPGLAEVAEALTALGYQRVVGKWQRVHGLDAAGRQRQRESLAGEVALGDSAEDVILRLRPPDRVARLISATQISEQWIYDGPPTLYIYFRRLASGNAHVTAILSAP